MNRAAGHNDGKVSRASGDSDGARQRHGNSRGKSVDMQNACYPVDVLQSDGKLVARVEKKGVGLVDEPNEPSAEQLNETPNAQGDQTFYKLLDNDDPKCLDWRRKLGQRLAEELCSGERARRWPLQSMTSVLGVAYARLTHGIP